VPVSAAFAAERRFSPLPSGRPRAGERWAASYRGRTSGRRWAASAAS